MAFLVSHPDEVRVVSKRFGKGATNIDRYVELDGYKAVQRALGMQPDAIIAEVKNSGLRGRGGAGFSTGMKWSFVPKQSAKPKYVLCNGDESEPGTCKDRLIFEHDPHAVIEGVMIAAIAVGSHTGYIYIRGEYRYLSIIMQKAIKDAYAKGFLGKNIFGSGYDLDIYWHGGAGAYEVGEESALMESLEGKRGIPRIRPTAISTPGSGSPAGRTPAGRSARRRSSIPPRAPSRSWPAPSQRRASPPTPAGHRRG